MTILAEIRAFKAQTNPLQDRYAAYIADKTIPLVDRWEVFREAPSDWKNHASYIQHFAVERKLPGGELSWYDDFYIERHETIDMVNLIDERLEELIECSAEDDEECNWTRELLEEFKEEILSKNLGSFEYDW